MINYYVLINRIDILKIHIFSASLLNYKATSVLFTHNLMYDALSCVMCVGRSDSGMVLYRCLLSDYIYE